MRKLGKFEITLGLRLRHRSTDEVWCVTYLKADGTFCQMKNQIGTIMGCSERQVRQHFVPDAFQWPEPPEAA